MLFWRRKKTSREMILELEEKIGNKKKEIETLKGHLDALCGGILRSVLFVGILSIGLIWVCVGSISSIRILRYIMLIVGIEAVLLFVFYAANKIMRYMLKKKKDSLKLLHAMQRINVERLKEETKYNETKGIVEKYQEEDPEQEDPEESVVERLVGGLL